MSSLSLEEMVESALGESTYIDGIGDDYNEDGDDFQILEDVDEFHENMNTAETMSMIMSIKMTEIDSISEESGIIDGIKNVFNKIIEFIKSICQKISQAISRFIGWIKGFVNKLVKNEPKLEISKEEIAKNKKEISAKIMKNIGQAAAGVAAGAIIVKIFDAPSRKEMEAKFSEMEENHDTYHRIYSRQFDKIIHDMNTTDAKISANKEETTKAFNKHRELMSKIKKDVEDIKQKSASFDMSKEDDVNKLIDKVVTINVADVTGEVKKTGERLMYKLKKSNDKVKRDTDVLKSKGQSSINKGSSSSPKQDPVKPKPSENDDWKKVHKGTGLPKDHRGGSTDYKPSQSNNTAIVAAKEVQKAANVNFADLKFTTGEMMEMFHSTQRISQVFRVMNQFSGKGSKSDLKAIEISNNADELKRTIEKHTKLLNETEDGSSRKEMYERIINSATARLSKITSNYGDIAK